MTNSDLKQRAESLIRLHTELDEEQLDLFRAEVDIFARKGLDGTDKAAAAGKVALRKRAYTALRELDGMMGTNIAADQQELQRRVNKYVAGKAAK